MAERDFDIHAAMAAVDRRDDKWFERQSDAAKKEFSPPVFLRWLSTVSDGKRAAEMLITANESVNPHMYELAREHPELVFKLAAMWCGTGVVQKHQWISMPGKRVSTDNKAWQLIAHYNPSASDAEIDMLMRMHTRETFAEFVSDAAADTKEMMAAYDKFKGKTGDSPKKNKRT